VVIGAKVAGAAIGTNRSTRIEQTLPEAHCGCPRVGSVPTLGLLTLYLSPFCFGIVSAGCPTFAALFLRG